mmetsp:Transcript_10406/g.22055  ORF Transcript_10406/g.22055 Transcript_10406/m.22055 type:complete len:261 (-) Transcript_10406:1115-1897(-)
MLRVLALFACLSSAFAFVPAAGNVSRGSSSSMTKNTVLKSSAASEVSANILVDPSQRDTHYDGNVAQYLCDLHDNKSTFDFCGGMMFQLVLSDALRSQLGKVAAAGSASSEQPKIAPSNQGLMSTLPGYEQSAAADNIQLFHGREVRKVKDAAGGMGFVLHLSLANGNDVEGWTENEIAGYDGWKHDVGRVWRTGDMLEEEGFRTFREKFGPQAFALHHKFYLHYDGMDRMWLSAEDGCEGTPSGNDGGMVGKLKNLLGM